MPLPGLTKNKPKRNAIIIYYRDLFSTGVMNENRRHLLPPRRGSQCNAGCLFCFIPKPASSVFISRKKRWIPRSRWSREYRQGCCSHHSVTEIAVVYVSPDLIGHEFPLVALSDNHRSLKDSLGSNYEVGNVGIS